MRALATLLTTLAVLLPVGDEVWILGGGGRVLDVLPIEPEPARTVWDDLADCESGDWLDGGAAFVEDSARWHVGGTDDRAQPRSPWSNGLFYGGLQFEPESWDWARDVGGHDVDPNPANNPREDQIAVAETLLEIHPAGWGAWPTCSRLVGLR